MNQTLFTANNLAVTVEEIKAKITDSEGRFKALKRSTREGLDRRHIGVKRVIECLTELCADDMPDHKVFLEDNIHTLFKSEDNMELFASMNLHWNYLAYDLLDHVIKEFGIQDVKASMERYKSDMKQFRKILLLSSTARHRRNDDKNRQSSLEKSLQSSNGQKM